MEFGDRKFGDRLNKTYLYIDGQMDRQIPSWATLKVTGSNFSANSHFILSIFVVLRL